jgi:hypothetical protein
MRIVSPGMPIRLWIAYLEDGESIPGLDHLKVKVLDDTGATLLSDTLLSDSGSPGLYTYDWTTSTSYLDKEAIALFTRSGEILCSEEYYFDIMEDMDGVAT